jgi:hypothetical protein
MKLTIAVLSVICCGCLASPVEKRSVNDGWAGEYLGSSYGLASAAIAAPSISTVSLGTPSITSVSVSAPEITSHTHTHSTAIIDRPVPVSIPTPSFTSTSYLPSTVSTSYLPSTYNYGLGLNSYPSYGSFGSYGYPSYGSSFGIGSKFYPSTYNYPSFGKYYARSYPTTIYKKTYISSPLKYKW